MSIKAHSQVPKPESSTQAILGSPVLQRQKTTFLDPDDSKVPILRGYDEFRRSIPFIPDNQNLGHNFAQIPVFSLARVHIQPKLIINELGDMYEKEAEGFADQVMRLPEPHMQRHPAQGEERIRPKVQMGQTLAPPQIGFLHLLPDGMHSFQEGP